MTALISRASGLVLGAVTDLARLVRPVRPLHPRGVALAGELAPRPRRAASGLDWLDDLDEALPVEARLSRGAGLPAPLPDLLGLALRVPRRDGGTVQLLFSTTGVGVPGRFLLAPRRRASGARLTTLMPFRGRRGPVLLGVLADDDRGATPPSAATDELARALAVRPWRLRLAWARPLGRWHVVADLRLRHDPAGPVDTDARVDPVTGAPPVPAGAPPSTYEWARRLREPSYRAARRGARRPPG